jgi:hypothetical protein
VYDFSHSPYVIAGEFLKRIWEEVLRGRSQAILGVPRLDRPKLKMLTPLLSEKTNKQSDLKVSKYKSAIAARINFQIVTLSDTLRTVSPLARKL